MPFESTPFWQSPFWNFIFLKSASHTEKKKKKKKINILEYYLWDKGIGLLGHNFEHFLCIQKQNIYGENLNGS